MDDELEETSTPRTPQLSKTPSWIMLGFVLGALAVYTLPRPEKKLPPPPAVTKTLPAVTLPPERPTVEQAVFFEDVFAQLNGNAVWQNERTEVAFWNASKRAFSDCYEVLRDGDRFYFRSIPHLTRPVLKEGVPADSPLQFTVPAEGYNQWKMPPHPELPKPQAVKPIRDALPQTEKIVPVTITVEPLPTEKKGP